jgi:hypothetical protein
MPEMNVLQPLNRNERSAAVLQMNEDAFCSSSAAADWSILF